MLLNCWTSIPNSYDGQSGCAGDIAWTYQNLWVKSAEPNQAPSSGAWGLLQWARRYPDKFFPLWARMAPQQADPYPESWKEQDEHIHQNISAMLAAVRGGDASEMDAAAGISG